MQSTTAQKETPRFNAITERYSATSLRPRMRAWLLLERERKKEAFLGSSVISHGYSLVTSTGSQDFFFSFLLFFAWSCDGMVISCLTCHEHRNSWCALARELDKTTVCSRLDPEPAVCCPCPWPAIFNAENGEVVACLPRHGIVDQKAQRARVK